MVTYITYFIFDACNILGKKAHLSVNNINRVKVMYIILLILYYLYEYFFFKLINFKTEELAKQVRYK